MEWISVKDQLPAERQLVLTVDKNWYSDPSDVHFGLYEEFTWHRWCYTCTPCNYEVTHWMPIPEVDKINKDKDGTETK